MQPMAGSGVSVRSPGASSVPGQPGGRAYSACYAPSVQLYFQPDGDVRACCRNVAFPLGNVRSERLLDIWRGECRRVLEEHLAVDDYSRGCQGCAWEVSVEGQDSAYPLRFEAVAGHLTADPDSGAWPRRMEFNLSNSCNLQCIQCNGDLSSSIRIHREGRPPLARVYGDEFFEDLRLFLPHLDEAQFAGGEPFLGAENFRAWDLIAEVAPDLRCDVVTNATQWNKRVERVLEKIPMGFTFSIDGITKETYDAVRVDADFDEVMANVDRFCAYAHARGTGLALNFCLMAQNFHEFGDLLLFAEERGIGVNVSVVHYPEHCSIARLDRAEIAEIHRFLMAQSDEVLAGLDRNAATWRTEVARIGSWLEGHDPGTDHDALWGIEPDPLMFDRRGGGPQDDHAAREALETFADGGPVHMVRVAPGEVILECSASAAEIMGAEPEALIGRPAVAIDEALATRHGARTHHEVLSDTGGQVDLLSTYGTMQYRTAIVAMREVDGYADHAMILFASRAAEPPS